MKPPLRLSYYKSERRLVHTVLIGKTYYDFKTEDISHSEVLQFIQDTRSRGQALYFTVIE